MKTLRIVLLLLVNVLIVFGNAVVAEQQRTISDKNEYGNKTIETTYEPGDKHYSDILKEIIYFDNNEKVAKIEHFYKDKFADEKGYYKTIAYYDSNEKVTKLGSFYTDKFADNKGYYKTMAYYDNNEKVTKLES